MSDVPTSASEIDIVLPGPGEHNRRFHRSAQRAGYRIYRRFVEDSGYRYIYDIKITLRVAASCMTQIIHPDLNGCTAGHASRRGWNTMPSSAAFI